ncbi:hypothetical protein RND81_02G155500 [Saponaria officinalis]|uniref:CCHC-type domain-containing protein n=1 Tax=Saponaria officinalis TaxID=3572 RepID=A0AAW1MVK2_SAPOF
MVRPSGEHARKEAEDVVRMRRLEDAVIASADNANHGGQQQQQPQQQSIFGKIARHRPPTCDGLCDLVVLEAWIREMEKLFIATLCPEDQKKSISRAAIQAEPGFGWARFCEVLKKRFYPDELKWQKEREFLRLEQGNLSVQAYADRFSELSRFATTIVPDEASRVRRFEKNLTPKVRTVLAGSPSVIFQQAYDRALSVYESPYHPGQGCDGTPMLCFNCKEPGHKSKDCPKNFPGAVRGPRSGSGSQAQKGRIFVMTRAEAESHCNVNPGIFLSNFIPTFILFQVHIGVG